MKRVLGLQIIRNGIDGYVVPINDLSAVKQKMSLLLSNEAKLDEMGRAGRQRVKAHYSVEREAKEITTFLKTLV